MVFGKTLKIILRHRLTMKVPKIIFKHFANAKSGEKENEFLK
jgi:hypothetical protein